MTERTSLYTGFLEHKLQLSEITFKYCEGF